MTLLIILFSVIALCVNIAALRCINLSNLTFADGIIIGMVYYVTIPMIFILSAGRIGPDFIPIPDYLPYQDVDTTFVILFAVVLLSGLRLVLFRQKQDRRESYPLSYLLTTLFVLYLAVSAISFEMSGISSGGHWYKDSAELLETNSTFLFLRVFGNFTRTALFGCLATLTVRSDRYRIPALLLGLFICFVDISTTFNRISVAYYLILILVCYRKHVFLACSALGGVLIAGAYVSSLWTDVRGLVSIYGYSLSGFSTALTMAIAHAANDVPFVDKMNGIFESINIPTFNYIVQNPNQFHLTPGAYFIRPLTLLLPRALVPDRPPPFAETLGTAINGNADVALNSTLLGEPYANSPYLWPVMILLVILVYHFAYRRLARENPAYGAIGAVIAFAFWRLDSSFAAYSLIFCLIIHFALRTVRLASVQVSRRAPRRRVYNRIAEPMEPGKVTGPVPPVARQNPRTWTEIADD